MLALCALLPSLALIGLLAYSPSLDPRTVRTLALRLAAFWAAIAAAAALYR